MTPMIDIVFQLIIFFMLVMDLSRHQLEPITLPHASRAVIGVKGEALVMNMLKDGTIRVNGRTFWRPQFGDDNHRLVALFERRLADGKNLRPVLIRADRSAEFQHLQKVLMIATRHGQVVNVHFGAKKEGGTR
jgi:biopolymer transport protein ExbD